MNYTLILLAQIFAILAFALEILTTQAKNKEKVLYYNGLSNLAYIIEYVCLSAWTGALCCVVALIRNYIFKEFKVISSKVLIIFIVLTVLINIPTIDSFMSIFPILNILLVTNSLSQNNLSEIKIIYMITSLLTIGYNIVNYAFVGVITATIEMISSFIGYIRIPNRHKLKFSK